MTTTSTHPRTRIQVSLELLKHLTEVGEAFAAGMAIECRNKAVGPNWAPYEGDCPQLHGSSLEWRIKPRTVWAVYMKDRPTSNPYAYASTLLEAQDARINLSTRFPQCAWDIVKFQEA